jgi:hypothetical protein
MVLNNNWKKIGLTELFTLALEHTKFIHNMSWYSHIRPVAQECIKNYILHIMYMEDSDLKLIHSLWNVLDLLCY